MDSDPYYSGLIGRVMDVMGSNMWDCFCGLKPMWPTFKCGGRTGTANRVTLGSKHFGRSKTRISIFLVWPLFGWKDFRRLAWMKQDFRR